MSALSAPHLEHVGIVNRTGHEEALKGTPDQVSMTPTPWSFTMYIIVMY